MFVKKWMAGWVQAWALAWALACAVSMLGGSVFAQDRSQTLADIRQELSLLYVEIQTLNRELSTSGAASGTGVAGTTTDRLNAIEGALTSLIAKTEELDFRINQIVRDGTNRIGDLEFRLVELEGGDLSQLGETTTLGGGAAPVGPQGADAGAANTGSGQMAMSEQADFDQALAALDAGNFADAVDKFQTFSDTYTGGSLTGQAHFLRGEALSGLDQIGPAARAYLTSFSGDPDGLRAPDALFKLGEALGLLGQNAEACATLSEVGVRFPTLPVVAEAESTRQSLGCN